MALLSLFKSKSERELEARIRFRQGKSRIQNHLQTSRRSADRYWSLARDAYSLGDIDQFRLLGSHYLRLRQTITRWQRFLVKLESLELRRDEVGATREFLKSIDVLTMCINRGVTPQEIARMQADISRAIETSRAQEQLLDIAMEAAGAGWADSELGDDPSCVDTLSALGSQHESPVVGDAQSTAGPVARIGQAFNKAECASFEAAMHELALQAGASDA